MIKIIIADDHQMFIDGIRAFLEPETEIEIVGEALDGRYVLQLLAEHKADLILLDINMPNMDGMETTKQVKEKFPDTRLLMLTMFNDIKNIVGLAEAGASGYILKNTGKKELMTAIQEIAAGRSYYGQEVMQVLIKNDVKKKNRRMIWSHNYQKEKLRFLNLLCRN